MFQQRQALLLAQHPFLPLGVAEAHRPENHLGHLEARLAETVAGLARCLAPPNACHGSRASNKSVGIPRTLRIPSFPTWFLNLLLRVRNAMVRMSYPLNVAAVVPDVLADSLDPYTCARDGILREKSG